MKVSYHAWKAYKECPKKFYLKHFKWQPPPVPLDDYHTIYGKLTEKFFEYFCNMWRFNLPYMPPDEIRFKLSKIYENLLKTCTVNWSAPYANLSKDQIFEQSFNDICAIMDSQNQNYFLNTKSEIAINVETKYNVTMTSRLDFIHKDPSGQSTLIFDGKGAGKIGKNVSNDQVIYYGLLYFFHFKQVPDELGFFYYRYNTFVPVEINLNILNEFRARLSLDIQAISSDKNFYPTPNASACKYCDYQTTCYECMESRAARKRKSKISISEEEGVFEGGL